MQALSRALQALGGEAPLAKALGVPGLALTGWLAGRETMPASVYLKAIALVPRGR
jgi:hypothetical protein